MNSQKIVNLILSLLKVGDSKILPSILSQTELEPDAQHRALQLAHILSGFYHTFDYTLSLEFQEKVQDKSDGYIKLCKKIHADVMKQKIKQEELIVALRNLHQSTKIYQLVPKEQHPQIDKAKALLNTL
ncbi:hypothetical protein AAG747_11085 [Rapidithrix thailandica]|uniref:Uncharacterized protein n=1 Tax=Rapidithrix thailandica TaxID=413964 RepID=A0AAW9SC34_9BACT